jgi:hypothetical protein
MQSSAEVLKADQPTIERVKVLLPFGFAERQARFLASVMLQSGVFVGRQYAAFAGITHGQKIHDFIQKLVAGKFVTAIELGATGRTKIFHVHHKPLYAAIGEPDNRNRRRVTIDRAIERLMVLDGVLADRSVTWLGSEREKRRYFNELLGDTPPGRRVSEVGVRQEAERDGCARRRARLVAWLRPRACSRVAFGP